MLYLIGLGLNVNSITKQGLNALDKCDKIYLEGYTVDFPYTLKDLEETLGKKITLLARTDVESNKIILEAKKNNIALLVYGSPLFATTHISLIEDCNKNKIKFDVIYSASVFDALGSTGLQLYKFGKIASMPTWIYDKNYKPSSFLDIVKENILIKAHSLILVDIGLEFSKALEQLKEALNEKNISVDKIVVCSLMGTDNHKIIYKNLEELSKINKKIKIEKPFCFIIPSEMHFIEQDYLSSL